MMIHQITAEERNFRLMLALIGVVVFFIATVPGANWPRSSISVASVPPLIMVSIVAIGALMLIVRYTPRWPIALVSLVAAELAVVSGWIGALGLSHVPVLWPLVSLGIGILAFLFAMLAGFLRIFQTVNPGEQFEGLTGQILWEALLPWAVFGGTFLALDGKPFFALWWIVFTMVIQFFWLPEWKVSRSHVVA
jgi:hypothetical protein